MKFDLHCHSYYSDGQLSPTELVGLAGEKEITHLALTDHDTLNGLPEARIAAQAHQIELINGVELSCSWNGQLLHIVGLAFDSENQQLLRGISANTERRLVRAQAMIKDFEDHDIDLKNEVESLLDAAVPTRPHFAQALVNLGYAKDKKQAFKRYLVPGKIGYIAMHWPDLNEIASWIADAGGVAVLAHPMRYKFTRTKLVRLIEEMKQFGIQGIEVSTPITNPQQSEMLANLCLEYDLYASIGSDFHSHDQPWARLGGATPLFSSIKPIWNSFQLS